MDNLKPCHFCMSDNIAVDDDEHSDIILIMTEYRTQIECRECGATITRYSDESMEHAHRAAVEAWNRRAHGGTAYMEGGDAEGI